MISAYVLVSIENAKSGQADPTQGFIKEVMKLGYVKEAVGTFGVYDAFLKIEYGNGDSIASELEGMKGAIQGIRDLGGVTTTMVLDSKVMEAIKKDGSYDMKRIVRDMV